MGAEKLGDMNGRDILKQLEADEAGFAKIATMLNEMAGIFLEVNSKNKTLVASRLSKIFRERGISSYNEYIKMIRGGDPKIVEEFLFRLTTNTTHFFREGQHFKELEKIIPELIENRSQIKLWCSAASSGQEPYTISMVAHRTLTQLNPSLSFKLLATDIDKNVLAKATQGVYSEEETGGIPDHYRKEYFQEVGEGQFQASEALRRRIRFAPFNLLEPKYPFQDKFDIVFCRNVLIYFEREKSRAAISKMIDSLRVGGYLFLGHSEAGLARFDNIESVASAMYRKVK